MSGDIFDQLNENFNGLIHLLDGDELIGSMEIVAAGSKVGTRQPHIGETRTVRATTDGLDKRRDST